MTMIDARRVNGVVFDLGRVLVQLDFSRGMPAYLRENVSEDLGTLAANPFFQDFNAGRLSPEEFFRRAAAHFRLPFDYEEFCRLWCDIFHEQPGMEELVSRVSQRYRINLLSDTDPLHWPFLCRKFSWLPAHFPAPALSYRLGSNKPAAANFLAAAAAIDLNPEDCLFIDDLPANVEGARATGMQALQFLCPEQLEEELRNAGILP